MTNSEIAQVYFNPACSKCRTLASYLDASNEEVSYVRYLESAPTKEELVDLMGKLGIVDPRDMVRRGEPIYDELDLDNASSGGVLDAITRHPILLERPIVVRGVRAIIARPPERVVELLDVAID